MKIIKNKIKLFIFPKRVILKKIKKLMKK